MELLNLRRLLYDLLILEANFTMMKSLGQFLFVLLNFFLN